MGKKRLLWHIRVLSCGLERDIAGSNARGTAITSDLLLNSKHSGKDGYESRDLASLGVTLQLQHIKAPS